MANREGERDDGSAPLGQLNEALGSPEADETADPTPTNPVDAAATEAVRSPARAALLLNVLGLVFVVLGLAAAGAAIWVLRPVWVWLLVALVLGAAGAVCLISARPRRA